MILAAVTSAHVIGLIIAVPSLYVGWLGYKRGRAADLLAAQAGIATTQTVTTGQVLDSLDNLIQRLSEDNAVLRAELEKANKKLDEQNVLIAELHAEVAVLRRNNHNGMEGQA